MPNEIKFPWPVIADVVAPALILAYGIGRIGCQMSGDGCWGIPNLEPKPEWLGFYPIGCGPLIIRIMLLTKVFT